MVHFCFTNIRNHQKMSNFRQVEVLLQALRESSEAAAVEELKEMSHVKPDGNPWWLETRCSSASSATCGIARKSSFSGGFYLSHRPLLQRSWNINGQIKILNRSNISPSHTHLKLLLAEWTPLIYAAVEDCADWKHWRNTMKCVSAIVMCHCQGVAF